MIYEGRILLENCLLENGLQQCGSYNHWEVQEIHVTALQTSYNTTSLYPITKYVCNLTPLHTSSSSTLSTTFHTSCHTCKYIKRVQRASAQPVNYCMQTNDSVKFEHEQHQTHGPCVRAALTFVCKSRATIRRIIMRT